MGGHTPLISQVNQFSARRCMGARIRPWKLTDHVSGPPAQSAKPPIPAKAKFFIPAAPTSSSNDQVTEKAAAETR
ncbi:unnamed protein product [Brassica rapa subsp. trilocularis]